MNNIIFILIAAVSLCYILLVSAFTIGFIYGRKRKIKTKPSSLPFVSVVVAFRNEEKNLPGLLNSLLDQEYPFSLYEIILSDDMSEDRGQQIVEEYRQRSVEIPVLLVTPPVGGAKGKKPALERALKKSKGEIIVLCDADCRITAQWLNEMIKPFMGTDISMVIGPVAIHYDTVNLFEKLQALEFMSLTGSTAGSAAIRHPVMCNGANLAYRKNHAEFVNSVIAGKNYASGDDMFMLQAFKKYFPKTIYFLFNYDAVAVTQPSAGLKDFFFQRTRWAGKSFHYTDHFTVFTAMVVAAFNLIMVAAIVYGIITSSFAPSILLLVIKMVIDFPLILGVASFMKQKRLMLLYPLLSILYPFYVSGVVLISGFIPVVWKQRITRR